MKELINNRFNLSDKQIEIKKEKVRALIVDSSDRIIVCEYCGVFLLPGGTLEENETVEKALQRELKEELGIEFSEKEMIPFLKIVDMQKEYPTREGKRKNRKITTTYFVINSDLKIDFNHTNLTTDESGNMKYHFPYYHDIYKLLSISTNNPRREAFDRELYKVILEYANTKNIDLHTHTSFSDGEFTKEELIMLAKNNHISVLGISDHDTIKAFEQEGFDYEKDFMLIPGVEISCKTDKGQLHILGYDYDTNNQSFKDFLTKIRNNHIENMKEINKNLYKNFEITITDEKIEELIKEDKIGRVYLAQELIKMGYTNSIKESFQEYLNPSFEMAKPSLKEITWKEAFRNIKLANGLVVLAHPISLKKNKKELENLIIEMKILGLDGIETYNQIYTNEDIKQFQELTHKYDLYQTIGSDFHGPFTKPNVHLANGSKLSKKIKKLNFVEEIKKRHNIK